MKVKSIIKKILGKSVLGFYHYCWALFGAVVFGFPSSKLIVIGVTGTSGKSTTTDFITRILEESGNKVASISTIRFKVGEKEWENKYKMSMPGRWVIQQFFSQAKKAGCKYVVLEVTSEGMRQYRHKFINFDTAVFTNIGQEHLESHGGFENYRNAKIKLFKTTKNVHVINGDDENAKYFLDVPARKKIVFSIKNLKNINNQNGLHFNYKGVDFNLDLLGDFNIMNALAAITVAGVYGVNLETCKKALEKAKGIVGRMEVVQKEPFEVVVDYAHTPEQLESAYKSLNERPLICVLGSCGGGRDKWKRPVLGEIAKKYCKEIIVTNEDPYDEDPMTIINQVAETAGQKAQKILDRKEAIKTALKLAKPNDIVIITGKGSEPLMCVSNGRKIPWSDKKIVKGELIKHEK